MSESLRELLRQGAASVDRPPLDVDALVAQAERRLRRRRLATVAASVVAVGAVALGSAAIDSSDDRTAPAPPGPTKTVDPRGTPRALVYAEGATIHLGDQLIDVGRVVNFVEATDDGVVFITDRDDRLWFTDGSAPEPIGAADIHHIYDVPVATANPGSLVAWRQADDGPRHVESVVVYDSRQRRVVGRLPTTDFPQQIAVNGDRVYWEQAAGTVVMRYDVSTGIQEAVSWKEYHADLARNPRMLVIGKASYDNADLPPTVAQRLATFKLVGNRLVASDSLSRGSEANETAPTTRLNGQPLRLRVPQGYDAVTESLVVVQWLDDARLVLFAYHQHNELPSHVGDFLVCPLPSGSCRVVVPASETVPYVPPGEVP